MTFDASAVAEFQKRCTNARATRWGPGPWADEPDRLEFKHAGFACLMNRGPHGAWCGYVGVTPAHPWHGCGYNDLEDVVVHGGLTYADACAGLICHHPDPGEPDELWWFGFDCSHAYDLVPGLDMGPRLGGTYRDVAYVRGQIEQLAEQLAGAKA